MFLNTIKYRLFLIILVIFIPVMAFTQSAYLKNGMNGVGINTAAQISLKAFEGVSLCAGYSISGVLDLGTNLGLKFDESEGPDSREMSAAIIYNVNAIKQNRRIPLSFHIFGSYGLMHVTSDSLDDNGLIKWGSGFTIGTDIYRDMTLSSSMNLRLGLSGSYESVNYQTTEAAPVPDSGYPISSQVSNIYYGCMLGMLFTLKGGAVIAPVLKILLDEDLGLAFKPLICITIPSESR